MDDRKQLKRTRAIRSIKQLPDGEQKAITSDGEIITGKYNRDVSTEAIAGLPVSSRAIAPEYGLPVVVGI